MIRKILATLFFVLVLVKVDAQIWTRNDEGLRIIDSKGTILRDSSSVQSKKITSIRFGEYVMPVKGHQKVVNDTVYGMKGQWLKVEYSGFVGFVFDAFVSKYIPAYNTKFEKGLPQFLYERDHICGKTYFYNQDLHWYGIYPSKNKNYYRISKTNVIFNVAAIYEGKYPDLEYWPRYLSMDMESSDSAKSVLIFGLPDTLQRNTIRKYSLPIKFNPNNYTANRGVSNNIYPGEAIGIGKGGFIICYGTVNEESFVLDNVSRNKFEDYSVQLQFFVKEQKITQDLNIKPNDSFEFIGDLNGDSICKIIIQERVSPNSTRTYLLMSGYEEHKLTKVAEIYWGSCY